MIKDSEVVQGIRQRYNSLSPLLVSRSIDRAKDEVELFDILESFPSNGKSVTWDDVSRRWIETDLVKLSSIKG